MNVSILPADFNKENFNVRAIHPMQSWEWGDARKEMGIEVLRLGEFGDGQDSLQNVYQMTLHKLPHTKYRIGYIPRSVHPSNIVLDYLLRYAVDQKILFIKIEPYEAIKLSREDKSINKSPHPLFPKWTIKLDLTSDETTLLARMKQKTRYNIRLAQKKGVVVKEESHEKGFETFLNLYFETCKRQRYFGHDRNYHKTLWKHLKDKMAYILIAYYNETPLAAYELFHFHDTLYYPYGGSSLEHKNVMAPNLLMWEAIRFGQKKGAKTFDMWGSLPPDNNSDSSWAGFTRFKEGYGGTHVEMQDSFDLVVQPALYSLYNFAHKARSVYLKFLS